MQLGLDYAGNSPGSAAVKAAGYSFVARYLSRYSPKTIKLAEYNDMTQNGVSVVLVFEDSANNALSGFNQGVADAQVALAQANALGFPATRPIHFAVDFDISDAQKPATGEYMKGVASVIGLSRTGAYGGYYWIRYCDENNLAAPNARWQATAWSGGLIHGTATLFQQVGGATVNGTSCDVDRQLKDDFGQSNYKGGNSVMSDEDAKDLYRFGLHREPENDQVWRPWVGQTLDQAWQVFRQSDEWLGQNDVLLVEYPKLGQEVNDLTAQLVQANADKQAALDAQTKAEAAQAQAEAELKALQDQQNTPPPVTPTPTTGNWFTDWINKIFGKKS